MMSRNIIPDKLVRWFLNDRAVKWQGEYFLPSLILLLTFYASWLFSRNDETIISAKDFFLALFSCFASFMMLVAWQHSKDIGGKRKRRAEFISSDLTLYFFTWALIVWQIEMVVNTRLWIPSKVDQELVASIFSSLNNICLLWATLDFDYTNKPSWMRIPLLRQFHYGRPILLTGLITISFSIVIYFGAGFTQLQNTDNIVLWFFLPDFIFSCIVTYLLCEGLIRIFISRFLHTGGNHSYYQVVKKWILIISILLIFLITMMAQIFHLFPSFSSHITPWFFSHYLDQPDELKKATENLQSVIGLTYRTFLTMLFFMLEISWVRMIESQKDQALMDESEINRNLKNEISHRLKNQLNTLAAIISRQLDKEGVRENKVAEQELSAILSRVYTSLLVHEMLDNQRGDGINNITLHIYLTELCTRLDALFAFPAGNFRYQIDSPTLDRNIPYAEARSLGSVLTDLLINVHQHAYAYKDENKWVEIIAESRGDNFFMCVSDRGKGLSGQDGKLIENVNGGRGLVLVKRVVERQLRGTIAARNGKSGGAIFEILIPFSSLKVK